MWTFSDYIHYWEGLDDGFIPFGVTRPSSKIPSCKDYARRLVREFNPRIVRQAPVQRRELNRSDWARCGSETCGHIDHHGLRSPTDALDGTSIS